MDLCFLHPGKGEGRTGQVYFTVRKLNALKPYLGGEKVFKQKIAIRVLLNMTLCTWF